MKEGYVLINSLNCIMESHEISGSTKKFFNFLISTGLSSTSLKHFWGYLKIGKRSLKVTKKS